jgi:hypothetical protein
MILSVGYGNSDDNTTSYGSKNSSSYDQDSADTSYENKKSSRRGDDDLSSAGNTHGRDSSNTDSYGSGQRGGSNTYSQD